MRQAKSAGMRSYINESVNPCDEFYGYACGNFAKINPALETISTDFLRTLNAGYQRRVRQLLNKPKMSNDSPTETRVKYFHESCLNAEKNLWNQRSQLIALFKEFGGFPALEGNAWNESKFDAIEIMAQLLNRFGKVTLLNVKVSPGLANSQINRLYLGQLDELESNKAVALHLSNQLKLMERLEKLLGLSESVARETAVEITKLNVKLAGGISEPQETLPPGQMNRLRMLNEMSDDYGPTLNLTRFVRSWLNHDYQLPVFEYGQSYFWQLKKILANTPKRVLANYMLSSLLQDFEMVPCGQRTSELFTDFVDHMVYRSLEQQNPHIPGSLRQLWQELKASFTEMLQKTTWLDEKTLNEALAKLKSMSFRILGAESQNFENYYSTLIISTEDYFGNVQRALELRGRHLREDLQRAPNPNHYNDIEVSPFYAMQLNRVVIPASYMQHRYLFDDAYPMAIKYGTVGFVLAHEMAHGFDDLSRFFDAQGNQRDWFERNATQQFEQRKQCLVNQFSEFIYNDNKLPKMQLQSENIADNVGVRIAHAAYLNWLRQQPES
ncbi:neprilysin-1 isoform X2 [Drosophila innubila]|uniref:neprilysin-1 isoform X2 n=1 Tax=Drosophila innubila TaxID=198719 RepID=UPI00148B9253|nr:neprilysin-1 isoform X2 [Drosophila innubila]